MRGNNPPPPPTIVLFKHVSEGKKFVRVCLPNKSIPHNLAKNQPIIQNHPPIIKIVNTVRLQQ